MYVICFLTEEMTKKLDRVHTSCLARELSPDAATEYGYDWFRFFLPPKFNELLAITHPTAPKTFVKICSRLFELCC